MIGRRKNNIKNVNKNKVSEPVREPKLVMQKTLKNPISCVGFGLHSGNRICLTINPASPNTGIVFRRVDIAGKGAIIPARFDHVVDTTLCSCIGSENGAKISTVEHLMAAFNGLGVDNAEVEINGSEVPAMDGSAAPFVFLIECAGLVEQNEPRRYIKVKKSISYSDGKAEASLTPAKEGLTLDFEIDFAAKAVGKQNLLVRLGSRSFKNEVSQARTFGFLKDIERLRAAGLARGGSLDNAVLVNEDTVVNEEGLRYKDEFVRHKLLDAVGDLYLAGLPIIGVYKGKFSGHAHTCELLRKLSSDEGAYEVVTVEEAEEEKGYSFRPAVGLQATA